MVLETVFGTTVTSLLAFALLVDHYCPDMEHGADRDFAWDRLMDAMHPNV